MFSWKQQINWSNSLAWLRQLSPHFFTFFHPTFCGYLWCDDWWQTCWRPVHFYPPSLLYQQCQAQISPSPYKMWSYVSNQSLDSNSATGKIVYTSRNYEKTSSSQITFLPVIFMFFEKLTCCFQWKHSYLWMLHSTFLSRFM